MLLGSRLGGHLLGLGFGDVERVSRVLVTGHLLAGFGKGGYGILVFLRFDSFAAGVHRFLVGVEPALLVCVLGRHRLSLPQIIERSQDSGILGRELLGIGEGFVGLVELAGFERGLGVAEKLLGFLLVGRVGRGHRPCLA